jgi:cardiolipin synthase
MTLANWLTVLRIVLIPVFIAILLQGRMDWALVAFVSAALTDVLDGFVARRTRITVLGRYLDPTADKLMLVSAYVILPFIDGIPAWVSVVVVSRDVIISLGTLIIYLSWGSVKVEARPLGKLSTLVQSLAVGYVILAHLIGGLHASVLWASYLVAAITAASGIDYILIGIRQANALSAAAAPPVRRPGA